MPTDGKAQPTDERQDLQRKRSKLQQDLGTRFRPEIGSLFIVLHPWAVLCHPWTSTLSLHLARPRFQILCVVRVSARHWPTRRRQFVRSLDPISAVDPAGWRCSPGDKWSSRDGAKTHPKWAARES